MDQSVFDHSGEPPTQRRRFERLEIRCRARIHIGNRHYAGYIHNISEGGVKLTTLTPIRDSGEVFLSLPDLPPLRGQLCWAEVVDGGVSFHSSFPPELILKWARGRIGVNIASCELLVRNQPARQLT